MRAVAHVDPVAVLDRDPRESTSPRSVGEIQGGATNTMTREQWRRITDVFHLARARDDAARIAVLAECCADDAVLRAEVEDLLAADRAAGEFGVSPLVAVDAVRLEAGSRLGQYEIVAFLAAGGMGEVYRARDIRLGRDVALKVLPDLLAHDAERLTRFKREAVVLAALNHPHVATLYGIEESHGRSALIMELVEGPTLAARLDEGPLDLVDALAMARQIADALAAAHDRGVIHRDLKPANIQLTSANDVKVLDFGLATSFTDAAVLAPPMSGAAESVGVICGTAAYMSPEQTRGGPVDRRADIWAFGCVLYEMLTGETAFQGNTAAETRAAVLQDDPDWSAFRSDVPESLRQLVASCLEKDVKLRRRDAADLSLEIEDLIRGHREARHARPHLATPRVTLRLAAIVSLIPAAFIGGRWATSRTPESNGQLVQTTIELPTDAPLALGTSIPINGFDRRGLALSPDGRMLAYVGQSTSGARLYRRDLGSREVTAVSGTEGAT